MRRQGQRVSPRRQRGVAALLVILLLGIAVGASVMLTARSLSSLQERTLSAHAMAPAQATAWRGVELVRRWLGEVDATALESWAGSGAVVPLAFTGSDLGISARLTLVEADGTGYRVTAESSGVAAAGGSAQTRATVEVVFQVQGEPGSAPPSTPGPGHLAAVNIYRDLDMTGGINVTGGEGAVFNVDGNVSLNNASITGIDTLRATGDISVGSGIHVRNIHSNGNVRLTGSASGTQVRARGDVEVAGGANPVAIRSNGRAVFTGGTGDVVEARGGVRVSGGGVTITSVRTEGDVDWTGTGGGVGSVHANGSVAYSGNNRPTTIRAQGNVLLPRDGIARVETNGDTHASGWGTLESLSGEGDLHAGGSVTIKGTIGGRILGNSRNVQARSVPGHRVGVEAVVVEEVPELTMPPPQVDAHALRAAANYVFEVVDGQRQVTVSQVEGIEDGSYVLGIRYANNNRYPDYLCRREHLQANGICSVPVATICQGYSPQNACFGGSGRSWKINGQSMARGVAWFDGDVELGSGTYVNTFIATGSITTAGSHRTLAPNYAGYAVVCTNAQPAGTSLRSNPDFAGLVPTNLCNLEAAEMTGSALANIAYLAGGMLPGGGYAGGDIDLGASTRADGAVLAGNLLKTGGSTTISGAILVAGQGADQGKARMGGSTTMHLSEGSEEYNPGLMPCEVIGCEDPPAAPAARASVLWTRYL